MNYDESALGRFKTGGYHALWNNAKLILIPFPTSACKGFQQSIHLTSLLFGDFRLSLTNIEPDVVL